MILVVMENVRLGSFGKCFVFQSISVSVFQD